MSSSSVAITITACGALLVACGARSTLDDAGIGGEATHATASTFVSATTPASTGPGSAGPTSPTSASTGVVTPACTSFLVDDPQLAVEEIGGAGAPRLALLPGGRPLLTWTKLANRMLAGTEIDAFGAWPPVVPPPTELVVGVDAYVVGPGPEGPVAYLGDGGGGAILATRLWPSVEIASAPIMGSALALFVAAIPGRYFYGWGDPFGLVELGSYAPGGLPQSEDPLVCVSHPLAAAIPAGQGFLAAVGRPNPPEPACSAQIPQPPGLISMVRQEHVAGAVDLATTVVDLLVLPERLYNLALTPTSYGGWLVFQTDGSASFEQPGVRAMQVLASGLPKNPNVDPIAVSPDGLGLAAIAAASMGDALIVAYVDAIDPSAPTIVLQRVEPDGALGARASIQTSTTWLMGDIQLVASPEGDAVLVAWKGGLGTPVIGLARVSCFLGI